MRPEELRERRLAAGMTQRELSRLSGVPQTTISKIENARRQVLPLTLAKLEQALDESGRGWAELLEAAKQTTMIFYDAEGYTDDENAAIDALEAAIQKIEGRR